MEFVEDWLLKGRIDAAICPAAPSLSHLKSAVVFEERYCCIYRNGHPRMRAETGLGDYLAEHHIAVAGSSGHDLIEEAWATIGIKPKVALRLPSLGVVGNIVAASDYLAVVPSRIAEAFSVMATSKSHLCLTLHRPSK
jgi:DNA-binding transcriptional LysR family regulator